VRELSLPAALLTGDNQPFLLRSQELKRTVISTGSGMEKSHIVTYNQEISFAENSPPTSLRFA